MKNSYFPQDGVWLKGNLHSHTTVSDGAISPKELAEGYYAHGYDFLSMSDHNVYISHNEMSEKQILLMTGVEHDIEYGPDKCTHVVGTGIPDKNKTNYECRRYSSAELTDQELIDMMREDGQFVTIAHPVWSRMEPEEIVALHGYHAIEVYNNGTEHLCHSGNAEIYWDLLLRRGIRVFATASDDVHLPHDLYGGWIWVKAVKRTKDAIFDALYHGAYYSSSGPTIYDFGREEDQIYISCSACREIHFVTYPPRGKSFFAESGKYLMDASHNLSGREKYVRVVCVDKDGRCAWTNPIFF